MTRLASTALIFLATSSLSACAPEDEGGEFRKGVPRRETVTMTVPGPTRAAQALAVESASAALKGETADLYKTTRDVSGVVNGGAFFVGALVRAVVAHPPTSVTADTAVWGPWTEPLEPITWKVTVTKTGDNEFQYKFDGQDKQNPAGPFVTVLSGTHRPARTEGGEAIEGYGQGTFTLDWDARNTLPMPEKDVGKAVYTYDRVPGATTKIDAKFLQVKDDDHPDRRVDVDYAYTAAQGNGGSMEFLWTAPAAANNAGGKMAVKSRWLETGAGRSDARAKSPDLKDAVTWSECWDPSFASTFRKVSVPFAPAWGAETDCVFPTADYSNL